MSAATAAPLKKDWEDAFLAAFEHAGTVSGACAVVGIARSTAYRERYRNESFEQRWHEVEDTTTDELELEACRRAKNGSDLLLIFLLKARKPGMYRENVKVPDHAPPPPLAGDADLSRLTAEEKRTWLALAEKASRAPAVA